MPVQWSLFLALVFALLVAIFSLSNVEEVPVNFLFMEARIPLIILILSSALAGATIVGLYGIFRQYRMQREIKRLSELVEAYQDKAEKQTAQPTKATTDGESKQATHPKDNVAEDNKPSAGDDEINNKG